uniref:Uncharacterized protein n=1 Tax=Arundo donax TaxID=35708 RepID=A0A0A9FFE6_ARUDO
MMHRPSLSTLSRSSLVILPRPSSMGISRTKSSMIILFLA